MRTALLLLITLITFTLTGQKDLEFVKIKNEDRSVDLSVINHTGAEYEIEVKVTMEGMNSDKPFPVRMKVPGNATKKIARLTPIQGQVSKYTVDYKVTSEGDYVSDPNLTIYTKNAQKRSTQLSIYLEQNGIPYNEINTTYSEDANNLLTAMLKRRGLEDEKVKLPVVIYKGEVHYNIKNVKKFCKEYLSEEGHFIKKSERRY